MQWLYDNKDWVFSGIGVVVISGIISLIRRKNSSDKSAKFIQISGNNCVNNQTEGNIKINGGIKSEYRK